MRQKHVLISYFEAYIIYIVINGVIAIQYYYDYDNGYENITVYNIATSLPASEEQIAKYNEAGNYNLCTRSVKECDPDEYSRLDGSCNNLQYPVVGTYNTPTHRMVHTVFGANSTVRTAQDGEELPEARKCRTKILADGKASHASLNMLSSYALVSFWGDFASIQDESNILGNTTYCCTAKGKTNDICAPINVPEDDPVHKFSGLRCMNMTKPLTLQYYGCAGQDTEPARIGNFTHALDMSFLYYTSPTAMVEARTYLGGTLKYEVEDGAIWPPKHTTAGKCTANVLPRETRCSKPVGNGLVGSTLITIWFYRMHNVVASNLGAINPCWSDDRLFYTTRQIVIAMWSEIQYYELMPLLLGEQNMIDADIISYDKGFRDIYDASIPPTRSADFVYAGRYFHTMQEGTVKMYDRHGYFVKEISITNLTQRTGYLAIDKNIALLTQGCIRQPFGDADNLVDPHMAEKGFGSLQFATDIMTNDLARGRLAGIAPYVKYRDLCGDKEHRTYDDISGQIRQDRLATIKKLYKNVSDVDALVGMWAEKLIPNGACPYTVSCILTKELQRIVKTDRHWYERPNRPHAFTLSQLLEIREVTAAYVLCAVGDGITRIQPKALLVPGPGNEICSCSEIPKINFWAWRDHRCRKFLWSRWY